MTCRVAFSRSRLTATSLCRVRRQCRRGRTRCSDGDEPGNFRLQLAKIGHQHDAIILHGMAHSAATCAACATVDFAFCADGSPFRCARMPRRHCITNFRKTLSAPPDRRFATGYALFAWRTLTHIGRASRT